MIQRAVTVARPGASFDKLRTRGRGKGRYKRLRSAPFSAPLTLTKRENCMDFNRLGHSGLRVPALSFGTATFGGGNAFFKAWGSTDAAGASRLIDVCLDHGVSLFDTADVYSNGLSEQILGEAIKGKRNRVLDLDQDHLSDERRAQRLWLVAPAHPGGGRGLAEAPRDRRHRRLPVARAGLQHAGRRDAVDARPARSLRQGALHRLLEFLGLAPDEVARGLRPLRLPPLCRASGLLLVAQPRL